MGGKSKTETKQDNEVDWYTRSRIDKATDNVRGLLADNPFQAYDGQRVAGQSDASAQAREMITGDQAQLGQGLLGSAAQMAMNAGGYTPQQVEAQSFADADLSAYQNPFTDQVIAATEKDIDRQRSLAVDSTNAAATQAGAFGGARHGVAEAETNRYYGDIAARETARLRSQGFDRASQLFQQDANRQLSADTTNAGLDMQGQQIGLQAGGLLGRIGDTISTGNRQDAALTNMFGAQDQALEQAELDAAYQEFLRGQADPWNRINVEMGLLSGTPIITDSSGSSTTSTNPGLLGVAGMGLQGASMFMGGGA